MPLVLAHEPASGGAGPLEWIGDLTPISAADWTFERAAHLLERAGFGGTPEDIQRRLMLDSRVVEWRML